MICSGAKNLSEAAADFFIIVLRPRDPGALMMLIRDHAITNRYPFTPNARLVTPHDDIEKPHQGQETEPVDRNPEADEIHPEDLEAAADMWDRLANGDNDETQ